MHTTLRDFITRHEEDQFRFLRELVLQPSYTRDKQGVDKVGAILARELRSLPLKCTTVRQSEFGDHLVFRSPACNHNSRPILLFGHMDTVFPPESGFNWYREENDLVRGPGVIDMKGGLATAVFALKALHGLDLLAEIPLTLICNSDEETGSPSSRSLIVAEAARSLFGMGFECGGLKGEIVVGRKGRAGYALEVTGQAGHAAFSGADKASAVLELARKIIAIEQLNSPARQLVVNVGQIAGGIGPNTVPEHASAQIDSRFLTAQDGKTCAANLLRIAGECTTPNTSATLRPTTSRLPMEATAANLALYDHIRSEADQLAIPILAETRSGVSDANEIASAGTPVIDGLGPIGACDHSDREYMLRESLTQRTLLAACSIASAWQRFTEGRLRFDQEKI